MMVVNGTARPRPLRLRRCDPSRPGLARARRGRGFSYVDADGKPVDAETRARIEALTIPPAWRDVWICPDPLGHLQATGIDAAGRKQYLYHPAWREQRDRQKFHAMEELARKLPRLRRLVESALDGGNGLTHERVGACAVKLLDLGMFRVGGEESAEEFGHFGLATLTCAHVTLDGNTAVFDYPAKSGVRRHYAVTDPQCVALLRRLRNRRGGPEELLAYREGRSWHRLGSGGINHYIKAAAGPQFSAKEFRTWNATVLAAVSLAVDAEPPTSRRGRERVIAAAIKQVSEQLGNTPAVARRAYVDPRVLDRYRAGSTIDLDAATRDAHLDPETSPLATLPDRRRRRLELAVLDLIE